MKKLVLSLALLTGATSFAQQRLCLLESFSQASCGPCASANPAMQALLDANTSKVVSIKYQTSWPGVDPMNAQNPGDPAARVTVYGVQGVPSRFLDGSAPTGTNPTQAEIDARYAVPSPINMTINHAIASSLTTADVNVTITAPAIWNPSNTVLHLVMVEKTISFSSAPGSNGETVFHNVCRKMYNSNAGTEVVAANFAAAGGSQTFTFSNLAIPSYIYDMSKVAFVAFVQNTSTKEVYQAGISQPQLLDDFGDISALSASPFSCATSLNGATATLFNNGATVITSATVNYQVDNGTVQTAPFTGNIALGGTASFPLPNITTTSGSHTLTVWLTNINNTGGTAQLGITSTSFAIISANGSPAPMTQDFAGTGFPYADYALISETGKNWDRNATAGAARYEFYNIAAGNSGDMILAPVSFAGVSAPMLSFDVAYRQYQAEQDELEVFVSSDCGATWTSVWSESGSTLANGITPATSPFTATAANFHNETVALTSMANQAKVFVKFTARSDYGNNLFVDNINIGALASIENNNTIEAVVYPNPATDKVNVNFEATGADYTVEITDLAGRVLTSVALSNANGAQTVSLATDMLASGNYLVSIASNGMKTVKTLSIN